MILGLQRIQTFHGAAELAGTGEEAREMSAHPHLEHKPHRQGLSSWEPPTCPAQSLTQGRLENLTKEDNHSLEDGVNSTIRKGQLL